MPPLSSRVYRAHRGPFLICVSWLLLVGFLPIGASFIHLALAQNVGRPNLRQWRRLAADMVEREVADAGIDNQRVLRAMTNTPRHEFVPLAQRSKAYLDMALPIGSQQTISPPFVVAYMTQELDPQPEDRVLEIGTGSGYQASILAPLVRDVYTIEIVESLGKKAARTLRRLGYDNVHPRIGDGYQGWPEEAPFDRIIVTCSPEEVPEPLIRQLAEGGRMIVPVGQRYQQQLHLFKKQDGQLQAEALRPTLFVPMTGTAESLREVQPDPTQPSITNGSFEETLEDGQPAGWHYQRQLERVASSEARDGQAFARFQNDESGLNSHALQGLPIDGRKVDSIRMALWVRGDRVGPALPSGEFASVAILFYDQRRALIGVKTIGPFIGSFAWRRESMRIPVPLAAREAIVRVGLQGTIGTLDLDELSISAAQ